MTINRTSYEPSIYNCNGITDVFPINLEYRSTLDLKVFLIDTSLGNLDDGYKVELQEGVDFIYEDDNVKTTEVYEDGLNLSIERQTIITQEVEFSDYASLPAETQEDIPDKITQILQETAFSSNDKAIQYSDEDSDNNNIMPTPVENTILGYDENNNIVTKELIADVVVNNPTADAYIKRNASGTYDSLSASQVASDIEPGLTTAGITDTTDKRFVTDEEKDGLDDFRSSINCTPKYVDNTKVSTSFGDYAYSADGKTKISIEPGDVELQGGTTNNAIEQYDVADGAYDVGLGIFTMDIPSENTSEELSKEEFNLFATDFDLRFSGDFYFYRFSSGVSYTTQQKDLVDLGTAGSVLVEYDVDGNKRFGLTLSSDGVNNDIADEEWGAYIDPQYYWRLWQDTTNDLWKLDYSIDNITWVDYIEVSSSLNISQNSTNKVDMKRFNVRLGGSFTGAIYNFGFGTVDLRHTNLIVNGSTLIEEQTYTSAADATFSLVCDLNGVKSFREQLSGSYDFVRFQETIIMYKNTSTRDFTSADIGSYFEIGNSDLFKVVSITDTDNAVVEKIYSSLDLEESTVETLEGFINHMGRRLFSFITDASGDIIGFNCFDDCGLKVRYNGEITESLPISLTLTKHIHTVPTGIHTNILGFYSIAITSGSAKLINKEFFENVEKEIVINENTSTREYKEFITDLDGSIEYRRDITSLTTPYFYNIGYKDARR